MGGGRRCSRCGGSAGSSYLIRLLAFVLGLLAIAWLIKRCRPRRAPDEPGTMAVPTWAYRRPDPLLYSQAYLSSLGLAVTWDNPDITVERAGMVVDQHDLAPATDYDVVVRVWNGSTSGPAVDMPVRVSYLDFGIGTSVSRSARPRSTCLSRVHPGAPRSRAFRGRRQALRATTASRRCSNGRTTRTRTTTWAREHRCPSAQLADLDIRIPDPQ